MAGHSKWKNIKRTKEANDAKKSKMFSKLSRAISVAAKEGGGDVDSNAKLRLAVTKAKEASMPKDSIQKAIQKGIGGGDSATYEETIYEGYGPGGIAYLINCLTDNKNRTVAEIRHVFDRNGGSLGAAGSTSYIFSGSEASYLLSPDEEKDVEKNLKLIDLLEDHDDVQEVFTNLEFEDSEE